MVPDSERRTASTTRWATAFPTGDEVAGAMGHGGPYPASTNVGATSVGTLSIRRVLRPVCYQNVPEGGVPQDLQRTLTP